MERITSLSLILFITLLFPLNIFAQQDGPRGQYPDAIINPHWEFYSSNWLSTNLAGKGFTGVASLGDISVISLNPASLNVENKYNANVSYSYKPGIDYLPDIFTDAYLRNGHPSLSAGGGYRINENFQVGFAYQNNYSYKLVYDAIYRNEFGVEIGRGELYYKSTSHSFIVPFVFNYEWLRLGANLNLTYLRGDVFIGESHFFPEPSTGIGKLWGFNPQIGFIITPSENFSFGASYTFGFSDNITWEYNDTNIIMGSSYVEEPSRLSAGVEGKLLENKLKLSLEYHYANTSVIDYLKDKNNIHVGAEYSIDDSWMVRGGFFTLLDFHDNWFDNSTLDQFFITLGGTYKYKGFAFNVALLSSSLTSSSNVKHSVINAGIGYNF